MPLTIRGKKAQRFRTGWFLLSFRALYPTPRLRSVHLVRLCLNRLPAVADALQNLLPVLVELELGDLALGRRDANGYCLAVGLFARDALDVDDVFETVDGGDLALAALV